MLLCISGTEISCNRFQGHSYMYTPLVSLSPDPQRVSFFCNMLHKLCSTCESSISLADLSLRHSYAACQCVGLTITNSELAINADACCHSWHFSQKVPAIQDYYVACCARLSSREQVMKYIW